MVLLEEGHEPVDDPVPTIYADPIPLHGLGNKLSPVDNSRISHFLALLTGGDYRQAAGLVQSLPGEFLKQHFTDDVISQLSLSIPTSLTLLSELVQQKESLAFSVPVQEYVLLLIITFIAKEKLYKYARIENERFPPDLPHPQILEQYYSSRNIVISICQRRPSAATGIKRHGNLIASSLEGLGCHGLVSTQNDPVLIDILDATEIELAHHRAKLHNLAESLTSINTKPKSTSQRNATWFKKSSHRALKHYFLSESGKNMPEFASHQRQIFVNVSDVKCRLHKNEVAREILQGSLRSAEISSLVKVLNKRIRMDADLLAEYKLLYGLMTRLGRSGRASHKYEQIAAENIDAPTDEVLFHFLTDYLKAFELVVRWLSTIKPKTYSSKNGHFREHTGGAANPRRSKSTDLLANHSQGHAVIDDVMTIDAFSSDDETAASIHNGIGVGEDHKGSADHELANEMRRDETKRDGISGKVPKRLPHENPNFISSYIAEMSRRDFPVLIYEDQR